MEQKIRVLFLCTGNTARSQMAEAFLKKYGDDRFEAHSAGLEPGPINPLTIKVMNEIGFPMSGHTSKSVGDYLGKMHLNYLITVCDKAEKNCPTIWPGLNQRLHWSFEDPAAFKGSEEKKLEKFREIRDQIKQKIREWVNE